MITAEEGVLAENNVFRIDPVAALILVVVSEDVYWVSIATPRPQSFQRYGSLIRENVIAPFSAEGSGEAHE
jgi:hypothetical protein